VIAVAGGGGRKMADAGNGVFSAAAAPSRGIVGSL
jgi:hypothetical protein